VRQRDSPADGNRPGSITRAEVDSVSIAQFANQAAGPARRVRSHKLLDDKVIRRLKRASLSGLRPAARRLLTASRSGHEGGPVGQAIEGAAWRRKRGRGRFLWFGERRSTWKRDCGSGLRAWSAYAD
jgi:hypothetical protein